MCVPTCTKGTALIQQALEIRQISFTESPTSACNQVYPHARTPYLVTMPGSTIAKLMLFEALKTVKDVTVLGINISSVQELH